MRFVDLHRYDYADHLKDVRDIGLTSMAHYASQAIKEFSGRWLDVHGVSLESDDATGKIIILPIDVPSGGPSGRSFGNGFPDLSLGRHASTVKLWSSGAPYNFSNHVMIHFAWMVGGVIWRFGLPRLAIAPNYPRWIVDPLPEVVLGPSGRDVGPAGWDEARAWETAERLYDELMSLWSPTIESVTIAWQDGRDPVLHVIDGK